MQSFQHFHRRLLLTGLLTVLMTALAVGLSIALPLFQASQDHIHQMTRISVQAHTNSLDHLLKGYQSVAQQFTSRTEIRKRLEAYVKGELSLEETRAFSQPRLADAAQKTQSLAGFYRLGPQGEIITHSGESFFPLTRLNEQWPAQPFGQFPTDWLQKAMPIHFVIESQKLHIVATALIKDDQGNLLGADILIFKPDHWLRLLQSPEHLHPSTALYLYFPQNHQAWLIQQNLAHPVSQTQPLMQTLLAHQSPAYLTPIANDQTMLFQSPLGYAPWDLVIAIPTQQLYHRAYDQLIWALGVILMLILVSGLATHFALKPLMRQLNTQTQKIEASQKELKQAASVFKNTKEAIAITHLDLQIDKVNQAFEALMDLPAAQANRVKLVDLMTTDFAEPAFLESVMEQIEARDLWQGEICYRTLSGAVMPTLQTISGVRNAKTGQLEQLIHIFNDIRQHKAKEADMVKLAHYDSLTGLPNRASILKQLDHWLVQPHSETLAVLFLDLDHFKPINDQYGHDYGDEVLKQVAHRLKHHVREDDWVGRLGGDEFLLLLHNHAIDHFAIHIAQKLIQTLEAEFSIHNHTVALSASIGIAYAPDDSLEAKTLLHCADQAMYAAKKAKDTHVIEYRTRHQP